MVGVYGSSWAAGPVARNGSPKGPYSKRPSTPPEFYFLAADGQGNVTAAIKYNSGGVEGRFDYGPFGEPLRATGPAAHDEPYTPTIAREGP